MSGIVAPGQAWEATHEDDPAYSVHYLTLELVTDPYNGWRCLELDTGAVRVMITLGEPAYAARRGMIWRRLS